MAKKSKAVRRRSEIVAAPLIFTGFPAIKKPSKGNLGQAPAAASAPAEPAWYVYKKGTTEFVGEVFADTYFYARDRACAQFVLERGDIDLHRADGANSPSGNVATMREHRGHLASDGLWIPDDGGRSFWRDSTGIDLFAGIENGHDVVIRVFDQGVRQKKGKSL